MTAVTAEKVDAIANSVPEDIKASGKLVVGVNVPYTPNEFKDPTGKIVGFDVDLMDAAASTLGLSPEYRESDFAKIIPSIQEGTFNVGMSSLGDTKERERSVDFVTYFSAGSLWAGRHGEGIDPENACGKKVAVQTAGTQELDELPGRSKKCTDAGKPAIEVLKFDGQDAATNAVVLGQADAMSADSPVTLYAIKQSNGKLDRAGEVFASLPYGWALAKASPLAQPLLKALEHLIQTGTYKQIATNWGVEEGVIDKPVINGAVS
ncbi:ABC transporter substrate-binding protein [Mycobacterium sp. AZCC_0083]|uniref:ABC transporter substrate-binding protein n=1 Tax=Mycobacterium sp. AZCC_0083 TaxID=2735882 RepID=UPI0018465A76|nr:ABC transporter substrate-binding protein [Mycobacterium sp. AZCC_0083]MBB5165681.1 polar amino acid transport system substrate-binding protein [Mycobacterium sp. AZCC_0083]